MQCRRLAVRCVRIFRSHDKPSRSDEKIHRHSIEHCRSRSGFHDAAIAEFLQSIWIAYCRVKPNPIRYFFLFDIPKSETCGQVPRKKWTTLACGNQTVCEYRQGRHGTTRKGFRSVMSHVRHTFVTFAASSGNACPARKQSKKLRAQLRLSGVFTHAVFTDNNPAAATSDCEHRLQKTRTIIQGDACFNLVPPAPQVAFFHRH